MCAAIFSLYYTFDGFLIRRFILIIFCSLLKKTQITQTNNYSFFLSAIIFSNINGLSLHSGYESTTHKQLAMAVCHIYPVCQNTDICDVYVYFNIKINFH